MEKASFLEEKGLNFLYSFNFNFDRPNKIKLFLYVMITDVTTYIVTTIIVILRAVYQIFKTPNEIRDG